MEIEKNNDAFYFRKSYLEDLLKFKDVPLVKILSGIRRCGKSSILLMYKNYLIENGVEKNQIIQISYSDLEFSEILSAKQMYANLVQKMPEEKKCYLLLDEVQNVEGWEKCVNSILENKNADIYVTGSNSKLLSSEISTYLSGRYVLIPVLPLSFSEFLEFKKIQNPDAQQTEAAFDTFLRFGGFPLIAKNNFDERTNYQIAEGIYFSVVDRDIAQRHNISNKELFDRVVRFVLENVGKNFSANSIVNFLKSQHRSTNVESVYNYLEYLQKAFIVYKCNRYDLQGKNVLKTQEKYYLADSSLKYALLGYNPKSVSAMLENIVFLELLRRKFNVYVGKNESKEIDFVGIKGDEKIYVQVCRSLPESDYREIENLKEIKDNFPKFVLTTNKLDVGTDEGIKIMLITDWLLGK